MYWGVVGIHVHYMKTPIWSTQHHPKGANKGLQYKCASQCVPWRVATINVVV